MLAYTHEPKRVLRCNGVDVPSFTTSDDSNLDAETVASFVDEWNKFNNFSPEDVERAGSEYFDVISNKDLFAPFFAAKLPLAYYMNKSFYIIRNDTLDRFGTQLQRRFSKDETTAMLEASGFTDIVFSPNTPYWHCVARKKQECPTEA